MNKEERKKLQEFIDTPDRLPDINTRFIVGVAGEDITTGDYVVLVIDNDGQRLMVAKDYDMKLPNPEVH